jgi:hypothetical protein
MSGTNDNEPPHLDWSQFEKDQHYDVAVFFALRDWMEAILKENGCEITDDGVGMGAALL